MPKKTVKVGEEFKLTASADATWKPQGRDPQTGTDCTAKYDSPGPRTITATFEIDVQLADIVVTDPPTPPGTKLPPGDISAAVAKGGTFLLQAGQSYSGRIEHIPSGTKILNDGDASKPKPRFNGSISLDGGKDNKLRDILLQGFTFDGAGIKSNGIDLKNVDNAKLRAISVVGYQGFGILVQGYGGQFCDGLELTDFLIADNFPDGGMCSGLYLQACRGHVVDSGVFDHNGWSKPGTDTEKNHNIYCKADCGPGTYTNLVLANASAEGLKARSGGKVENILSLDNPIGMTYGMVIGEACFPGGVSGSIKRFYNIGTRSIVGGDSPGPRGSAICIDNTKQVTVEGVQSWLDNHPPATPIPIGGSRQLTNAGDYVGCKPNTIIFNGTTRVWSGNPNLRNALGADFMKRARAKPAIATQIGLAMCDAAAGS